jgi:hypothetical protein
MSLFCGVQQLMGDGLKKLGKAGKKGEMGKSA